MLEGDPTATTAETCNNVASHISALLDQLELDGLVIDRKAVQTIKDLPQEGRKKIIDCLADLKADLSEYSRPLRDVYQNSLHLETETFLLDPGLHDSISPVTHTIAYHQQVPGFLSGLPPTSPQTPRHSIPSQSDVLEMPLTICPDPLDYRD